MGVDRLKEGQISRCWVVGGGIRIIRICPRTKRAQRGGGCGGNSRIEVGLCG